MSAAREKWNDVDRYVGLMDRLSAGSPEVLVAAAEIAATVAEEGPRPSLVALVSAGSFLGVPVPWLLT